VSAKERKSKVIEVLMRFPSRPNIRIEVTLERSHDGGQFVRLRRWVLKAEAWTSPAGICLQLGEVRSVSVALEAAAETVERPDAPADPEAA